jgi:hypothetical protein
MGAMELDFILLVGAGDLLSAGSMAKNQPQVSPRLPQVRQLKAMMSQRLTTAVSSLMREYGSR